MLIYIALASLCFAFDIRIEADFPCDGECRERVDEALPRTIQLAENLVTRDYSMLTDRQRSRAQNALDLLTRTTRSKSKDLCLKTPLRIPGYLFVEKYVCPLLKVHLSEYCVGRSSNCFRCTSNQVNGEWEIQQCQPNPHISEHNICSDDALASKFCHAEATCPISFYSATLQTEKSEHAKSICCRQQVQMGQKLTCQNAWKKDETQEFKKLNLMITFAPCRGNPNCLRIPSNGLTISLNVYSPTSCCAMLAWT